ncbi:hypothetical protein SAMN05421688_1501 [Poseidonocella pacifica]|uniref:Uncharacterized protein n=1 Tax=Poseidonocella pacifica TaxID=871651 RepID=A0A1I0WJZ9_9RHOB|nr:hypothetical protein [Poseidonocella pacifica]SFA88884.1 hypothetical protein SAMN05421688_1501 [Poseidonocella pacifica]
MPLTIQIVPCNFVGDFKVGDNLVYNAGVLTDLAQNNEDGRFNKLISLQAGSILEASMAEIIFRAQNFNREGVPNILEADRQEIAGKKIDKFNNTIDVFRKYSIIDGIGGGIYEDLHVIRKFRNKIHVQDDISIAGVSRDEVIAFDNGRMEWIANKSYETIFFLSQNYSRPRGIANFVGDLRLPRFD